jgi:hypothetical protein
MQHCQVQEKSNHYPVSAAGVWVDCIRERRTVIHNDYKKLQHRRGLPQGHVAVIREMSVPLFDGNTIVAILGVGNKESAYTAQDETLITLFAQNAWNLIIRKRTYENLQEHKHHLENLVLKRTETLEKSNAQLQEALNEIHRLRGLLPICPHCKKVRDCCEYWQAVEEYIAQKPNLMFSHGLCPDCFMDCSKKSDTKVHRLQKSTGRDLSS